MRQEKCVKRVADLINPANCGKILDTYQKAVIVLYEPVTYFHDAAVTQPYLHHGTCESYNDLDGRIFAIPRSVWPFGSHCSIHRDVLSMGYTRL
jgi:hypothetical protein